MSKRHVALQLENNVESVVVIEEPKTQANQEAAVAETVKTEPETLDEFLVAGREYLIGYWGNTSGAIRALAKMGAKNGPISRALGIRFQHARNVLNQPLKRKIKADREAAKNGVNSGHSDDDDGGERDGDDNGSEA